MTNLLPPQAQKTLSREYWLRILTVWAFLSTGLFITASLLLIPTYVLIHSQLTALENEDEKNEEIENKFRAAEAGIIEANILVGALSDQKSRVTMSSTIDAIRAARTGEIQFKTIILSRVDGKINTVQVQGQAASRASLIQLKSTLERSALFESVTVPLSDLARDIDLPFAISISLADLTK